MLTIEGHSAQRSWLACPGTMPVTCQRGDVTEDRIIHGERRRVYARGSPIASTLAELLEKPYRNDVAHSHSHLPRGRGGDDAVARRTARNRCLGTGNSLGAAPPLDCLHARTAPRTNDAP